MPESILLIRAGDSALADQIARELERQGAQVLLTGDAEEALRFLDRETRRGTAPALIVLPDAGEAALAAARRLRSAAPDASLVFLGDDTPDDAASRVLLFEPALGSAWALVSVGQPAETARRILELASDAARRREHRSTLAGLNARIGHLRVVSRRDRLLLAESHLASLLAHAEQAIFSTDSTGAIVSWNRAAERAFGWTAKEATGRSLDFLLPPEERGRPALLQQRVEAADGPVTLDVTWPHPGEAEPGAGPSRCLAVTLASIRGPNDEKLGVLGMAVDVTEQRQAELRRQTQYAVSRVLVEAASVEEALPAALRVLGENLDWDWCECWQPDQDGLLRCRAIWRRPLPEFDELERATRELALLPGEGLAGHAWTTREPTWLADLAEAVSGQRRAAAVAAGLRAALAFRLLVEDGTAGVLVLMSRNRREPDPDLRDLIGSLGRQIGQFIARKRVEAALRDEQERQRFLAEAAQSLAASLDLAETAECLARLPIPFLADATLACLATERGVLLPAAAGHRDPEREGRLRERVRDASPGFLSETGAVHLVCTERPLSLPEDEGLLDPAARAILREAGARHAICLPLVARDRLLGTLTLARSEARPAFSRVDEDTARDLAHRAALALDNARLYGEVQAAAARKDEFLAMLSHELRNPLASIQNSLEILRVRAAEDPDLAGAREVLERNVTHLTRLVDDLLDVARITRGRIELRRERVPLRRLLEDAVRLAAPAIEQRGHTLVVTQPSEPVELWVDVTRLEQVIGNLLHNAAKFTPPSGRIDLVAEVRPPEAGEAGDAGSGPGWVTIRVRDTGKGIPPEMLPHIFDLFTQVNPTLDRAEGGLGIGLTLVKNLVERHGGRVEAHSDGPGQGAEFRVHLPLADPAQRPAPGVPDVGASGTPGEPSRGRRVLVVDDRRDAAETLAEILELWGHSVRIAYDGAAALEEAVADPPEVVLLDIGLPGMDGYEVARRMRTLLGEGALLIAVSGYGAKEDRERARCAGFDSHLVKPVDIRQLQRLLAGE